MEYDKELMEQISELLGQIYANVKWKKMRGRSAYDVFEHRLLVASYQPDVLSFLKKLCHGLSLQAPPGMDIKLIEQLNNNKETLRYIRSYPQYFVYKASQKSKEMKEERGKKRREEILEKDK
jgi:hypothetical protein